MGVLMTMTQANTSRWGPPTGACVGVFIPDLKQSMNGVRDGSRRLPVIARGSRDRLGHPPSFAKRQFCPLLPSPQTACHLLKDTGIESPVDMSGPEKSLGPVSNFEGGENEDQRRDEITQDHSVSQNPSSVSSLPGPIPGR